MAVDLVPREAFIGIEALKKLPYTVTESVVTDTSAVVKVATGFGDSFYAIEAEYREVPMSRYIHRGFMFKQCTPVTESWHFSFRKIVADALNSGFLSAKSKGVRQ